MGLPIQTPRRDGKRLDGVGMRRYEVPTNGNEMGVVSIWGWVRIMVGSADVGFWMLRMEFSEQVRRLYYGLDYKGAPRVLSPFFMVVLCRRNC